MNKHFTTLTLLFLLSLITACSQNNHTYQPPSKPALSIPSSNIQYYRQQLLNLAHQTKGAGYKWGGSNPEQGFDCSGLMKFIYKQGINIDIPRTTTQQRLASRTIDYNQLQIGDLLFFKTGKTVEHVGVYVGDRKFIHASTGKKKVIVASMDSQYWHSRFVKFGSFL